MAIVKHSHHKDDLDTAEKDTWRFTQAGSELSAINSLDHLAIYRRMDEFFDPRDIADYILWDFDILLTEGYKSSDYPKIEVHRGDQGDKLITDPALLMAVVTDKPLDVKVPQFAHDDIKGIADMIEKTAALQKSDTELELVINGKKTSVTPGVKDRLTRAFTALIPELRKNGKVKNLQISLRRKS